MKLRRKIVAGYCVVAALTAVVGYLGVSAARVAEEQFRMTTDDVIPEIKALEELRRAGMRIVSSSSEQLLLGHLVSHGRSGAGPLQAERDLVQRGKELFQKNLAIFVRLSAHEPIEVDKAREIEGAGRQLCATADEMALLSRTHFSDDSALGLKERFELQEVRYLKAVNDALDHEYEQLEAAKQDTAHAISTTGMVVGALSALTALLGVVLGSLQSAAIVGPLNQLRSDAERIGRGDLETPVATGADGETGQLAASFERMRGEMRAAYRELRSAHDDLEHRVAERTAQLSLAVDELEAFSYTVSHDLRVPLQAITGYNGLLLETCRDRLMPREVEYLQQVDLAAGRMQRLIDDLLDFATVSHGELRLQEVDLSAMARSIVSELRAAEPGRAVDVHLADGITAVGDAALLQVVLVNLLGNAWKYTGRSPQPRIEFGRLVVRDVPVFYVQDNGDGFNMAHVSSLFTPFRRLHRSEQFKGTGIGLATVKRVVVRHGGAVRALGRPGMGAVFWFSLQYLDDRAMDAVFDASPFSILSV